MKQYEFYNQHLVFFNYLESCSRETITEQQKLKIEIENTITNVILKAFYRGLKCKNENPFYIKSILKHGISSKIF